MMHEPLEVEDKSDLGRREERREDRGQDSHLLVAEGGKSHLHGLLAGKLSGKTGANMGYHGPKMQRTDAD